MKKTFLASCFGLSFYFLGVQLACGGNISMTTFYPAPFGKYDRLQLIPRQSVLAGACEVGSMYVNPAGDFQYCKDTGGGADEGEWGPMSGLWEQVDDMLYVSDPNTKIGIGRSDPDNTLDVNGTVQIEVVNADPQLKFLVEPYWYSIGIDESDGKFKITFAPNVGATNAQITMDSSGNVEIGGQLMVKNDGQNQGQVKVTYVGGETPGYYATYAP